MWHDISLYKPASERYVSSSAEEEEEEERLKRDEAGQESACLWGWGSIKGGEPTSATVAALACQRQ